MFTLFNFFLLETYFYAKSHLLSMLKSKKSDRWRKKCDQSTPALRKGRWCLFTEIFCRQRFPETSHVRSWHRDGWVHLRYWRFQTWQLCEYNCWDLAKLTRCLMWRRFDIFMKTCSWGEQQKSPCPSSGFGRPGEIPCRRDFVGTSVQRKSTVFGQVDWLQWAYLGAESQRAWWVWYTDCSTTNFFWGQREAGIMWQLHRGFTGVPRLTRELERTIIQTTRHRVGDHNWQLIDDRSTSA